MNIDDERDPIALDRTTLSIPCFVAFSGGKPVSTFPENALEAAPTPAARGSSLPYVRRG
jgi:hypothetical protein